ncbi:MAG: autotransporter-associated beta strand repeat-containing protein, partial [Pirellulales bacterium]
PLSISGGGLRLGGTNNLTFTGSAVVVGGNRDIGNYSPSAVLTLADINLGTRLLQLDGGANDTPGSGFILGGAITGSGTFEVLPGVGSRFVRLSGSSTYAGGATLGGGVVQVGVSTAGGPGAITSGPFGTGGLTLTGGTITGSDLSTPRTIANNVTLAGPYTIGGGSYAGSIVLTGTLTGSGGDRTLSNGLLSGGTLGLSGPVYLSEGSAPRILTIDGAGSTRISGVIADAEVTGSAAGSGLTKAGAGVLWLDALNTFTGTTTVTGGTLFVNGGLGDGPVVVGSLAALGGTGTIGGNLTFAAGSAVVFNPATPLTVLGQTTFSDPSTFGIDDVIGLNAGTSEGTYTIISGSVDTVGLANLGAANAYDLGSGKSAYFLPGSLQLIVVPEPAYAATVAISVLLLAAARRAAAGGRMSSASRSRPAEDPAP